MATKPTSTIDVFAADELYSVGPKSGEKTKADNIGPLASQGHVPGKTNPTSSNEFNRALHDYSEYLIWVSEGSSSGTADAHIVETDNGGQTGILALNLGDELSGTAFTPLIVRTNPSASSFARFIPKDKSVTIEHEYTSVAGSGLSVITDGFGATAWSTTLLPTASSDSFGGLKANASTDRVTGFTSSAEPRRVGAANFVNDRGQALEVIGENASGFPAAHILGIATGQTSLEVGLGAFSVPEENRGGIGVDAWGGNGDGTTGLDGGAGVRGTGGNAVDDGATAAGGPGVWARGGVSGAQQAGPGLLAQSQAEDGVAAQIEHLNPGATANLLYCDTGPSLANGIVVSCESFGTGLTVEAQGGNGIKVSMTDNGGFIGAALRMDPQDEPSGQDAGDVWVQDDGEVAQQIYAHLGNANQTIARTRQPYCALSQYKGPPDGGSTGTPGAWVDQSSAMTFETPMAPTGSTDVILKAFGTVDVEGVKEISGIATRWLENGSPIHEKTHDTRGTGARSIDIFHLFPYTIPSAGVTSFVFQYRITTGGTELTLATAIGFWYEVHAIPGL